MKRLLSLSIIVLLIVGLMTSCQTSTTESSTTEQSTTEQSTTEKPPAEEKEFKIGMIPKFTGVDYFIACENGAKKAAEEFGVILDWQGDPSGQESVANQQAYIQTFIDKDYDAILISALDSESYADTLKSAMDKGILILTWDADVRKDARNFFVNQTENSDIGKALMEAMGASITESGEVAIISSDPNASNQNAWIAAIMAEYESKKDSDYKLIEFYDNIIYAGNNQADADRSVNTLLTQNPNIKGVFGISSMATPAIEKACKDFNIPIGDIAISALGLPPTSIAAMQSGLMPTVVLWQPYDLGYLTVQVAADILKGNASLDMTSYVSNLSGKMQVADIMYPNEHKITEDKQIILGPSVVYDLDNAAGFKGYPDATSGLK